MGTNLAAILHAKYIGPYDHRSNQYQVAKLIAAQAGSLSPHRLSAAHVAEIDDYLKTTRFTAGTRATKAKALRQILRYLWEYHGAPKLDHQMRRYPAPRPRNITVTEPERERILTTAPPHLRLWLVLCSDLAIRCGTSIALGPANYDQARGNLTFTTKCDEHLTLPVTAEIAALIDDCDQLTPLSFVRQLWLRHNHRTHQSGHTESLGVGALGKVFRKHLAAIGIDRHIRPHDLRRTTAVALYATHTTCATCKPSSDTAPLVNNLVSRPRSTAQSNAAPSNSQVARVWRKEQTA